MYISTKILHLNKLHFDYILKIVFMMMIMVISGQTMGQVEADTTKKEPIVVINADKTTGFNRGEHSILSGDVVLRQDSTVIYANKVNLYSKTNLAQAFGDVIIQRSDTTNAFCQELEYDGNTEYATMSGEVVLENGRQKLYADKLEYDMSLNVAYYDDKALMTDGDRLISSKKGSYYVDSSLVVFVDSVVVAGADYSMRTDSLHFNTRTNTAHFVAPVRMKQKDNAIYCEAGYYDLQRNFAVLRKNAQFSSPTKVASADTILFHGKTEDITLIGIAWFQEDAREVEADHIVYKKSEDIAILIGNVKYKDDTQSATGERMEYVLSTGKFKTEGRAEIRQESQYLAANEIEELSEGNTIRARGDVVWKDTVEQISLYCQDAFINKTDESIKAFGERLLLVSMMKGDSLFITADTLLSIQKTTIDSVSSRQLFAYYNVVGYKNNLQFVADSVSFGEQDSLFKIFGDPVIWSDTSRFFGDTIIIQMANDAIDELSIIDNAFIVNKNNDEFYNQVKGRLITAKFVDQQLHSTHVKGNAESVYYAVDQEQAYVGVNKIACSEMNLEFINNQIGIIRFYRQPVSTFYPMQDVDHSQLQLEGFSYDEQFRSKSPDDIYRVYELVKNK